MLDYFSAPSSKKNKYQLHALVFIEKPLYAPYANLCTRTPSVVVMHIAQFACVCNRLRDDAYKLSG